MSEEDLQHLLSRLIELKDEFERAILSGSEYRIRAAEAKFKSAMHWVESRDILTHGISKPARRMIVSA